MIIVLSVLAVMVPGPAAAAANQSASITASDQTTFTTNTTVVVSQVSFSNLAPASGVQVTASNASGDEFFNQTYTSSPTGKIHLNGSGNTVSLNTAISETQTITVYVKNSSSEKVLASKTLKVTVVKPDASVTTSGWKWQGQQLSITDQNSNVKAGDVLELMDDSGNPVGQINVGPNGQAIIDTSNLEGTYDLNNSNVRVTSFKVVAQTVSASFADSSATTDGSSSSQQTALDVNSNRGSWTATITANGLDGKDLQGIFGVGTPDGDKLTGVPMTNSKSLTADFAGVATGDYTFTVESSDTTAKDTASITVTKVGSKSASFPSAIVQGTQGDTVSIPVNLQNTDTATVWLGSKGVNYLTSVQVKDGNGDGKVTLQMNSYLAGRSKTLNKDAFSVKNSDDSIESVSLVTNPIASGNLLDTGDYEMNVSISGTEKDVGTFFLNDRSTDGVSVMTAPSGTSLGSLSDIQSAMSDGTLTADTSVTTDDLTVYKVTASGIYGMLDNQSGANTTASFNNLVSNGSLGLAVKQTNPGANAKANSLTLGSSLSSVTVVPDSSNNTLYVVLDASGATWSSGKAPADGDNLNTTFTVYKGSMLASKNQSVTASYSTVKPTAEFSQLTNDKLVIPGGGNVSVAGTSNYAAGTELTVRFRSSSSTNPFLKQQTVTVGADGTWTGQFDMSGLADGTTFSASIRKGNNVLSSKDGQIGIPTTTTPQVKTVIVTQPSPTPKVVTKVQTQVKTVVKTSQPKTVVKTVVKTSTSGQPGFGIAVAIMALLAAALLAIRRRDW